MTLGAEARNIPVITSLIDAELERRDCPVKAQMQIDMAVDEIAANIAAYAYPGGRGCMTVRLDFRDGCAELTFTDGGVPYDPTRKEDPDTTLPAGEREVGGLGIFLVKKTMDGIAYRREDGQNILTLRKRIAPVT